jgi:hypothetical protein
MISSHVCIGLKLCFVCVLVVYLIDCTVTNLFTLEEKRLAKKFVVELSTR